MSDLGAPRWSDTLAELMRPRRLVPIGLIASALVAGQVWFTPEPGAVIIALILVAVFVVLGPHAWRRTFGAAHVRASFAARTVLFVGLGLFAVALFGWALPRSLDYGHTFLSAPGSVLVEPALFWVGAWGLGRDIELEARAAAAEARSAALAKAAEEAQLLALRAHLDPHFLFNTLNALAEWCRLDPVIAERGVLGLAALLRGIFAAVKASRWTLDEELGLLGELFALHRLRDPEAFHYSMPGAAAMPSPSVPALLLLPLAENAITHGVARGHRGAIEVRARVGADGGVEVVIESPGVLEDARRDGHGLASTRARLAHAWGAAASLAIVQADDGRVRVTVRWPGGTS